MRWSASRELEAIVEHAAGRCALCRTLLLHSRRRSDRQLLEAAESRAEEREAFAEVFGTAPRPYTSRQDRP